MAPGGLPLAGSIPIPAIGVRHPGALGTMTLRKFLAQRVLTR